MARKKRADIDIETLHPSGSRTHDQYEQLDVKDVDIGGEQFYDFYVTLADNWDAACEGGGGLSAYDEHDYAQTRTAGSSEYRYRYINPTGEKTIVWRPTLDLCNDYENDRSKYRDNSLNGLYLVPDPMLHAYYDMRDGQVSSETVSRDGMISTYTPGMNAERWKGFDQLIFPWNCEGHEYTADLNDWPVFSETTDDWPRDTIGMSSGEDGIAYHYVKDPVNDSKYNTGLMRLDEPTPLRYTYTTNSADTIASWGNLVPMIMTICGQFTESESIGDGLTANTFLFDYPFLHELFDGDDPMAYETYSFLYLNDPEHQGRYRALGIKQNGVWAPDPLGEIDLGVTAVAPEVDSNNNVIGFTITTNDQYIELDASYHIYMEFDGLLVPLAMSAEQRSELPEHTGTLDLSTDNYVEAQLVSSYYASESAIVDYWIWNYRMYRGDPVVGPSYFSGMPLYFASALKYLGRECEATESWPSFSDLASGNEWDDYTISPFAVATLPGMGSYAVVSPGVNWYSYEYPGLTTPDDSSRSMMSKMAADVNAAFEEGKTLRCNFITSNVADTTPESFRCIHNPALALGPADEVDRQWGYLLQLDDDGNAYSDDFAYYAAGTPKHKTIKRETGLLKTWHQWVDKRGVQDEENPYVTITEDNLDHFLSIAPAGLKHNPYGTSHLIGARVKNMVRQKEPLTLRRFDFDVQLPPTDIGDYDEYGYYDYTTDVSEEWIDPWAGRNVADRLLSNWQHTDITHEYDAYHNDIDVDPDVLYNADAGGRKREYYVGMQNSDCFKLSLIYKWNWSESKWEYLRHRGSIVQVKQRGSTRRGTDFYTDGYMNGQFPCNTEVAVIYTGSISGSSTFNNISITLGANDTSRAILSYLETGSPKLYWRNTATGINRVLPLTLFDYGFRNNINDYSTGSDDDYDRYAWRHANQFFLEFRSMTTGGVTSGDAELHLIVNGDGTYDTSQACAQFEKGIRAWVASRLHNMDQSGATLRHYGTMRQTPSASSSSSTYPGQSLYAGPGLGGQLIDGSDINNMLGNAYVSLIRDRYEDGQHIAQDPLTVYDDIPAWRDDDE